CCSGALRGRAAGADAEHPATSGWAKAAHWTRDGLASLCSLGMSQSRLFIRGVIARSPVLWIERGATRSSIGGSARDEFSALRPAEDAAMAGKGRAQREGGRECDRRTRDEIARVMLADRDAREEDEPCQGRESLPQARRQHAERQCHGRNGVGM